jgi:hypothetical protein
MPVRQIFNAATQQIEDAEMSVDANNEIVATFADGSFVKFPSVIVALEPTADGTETITTESPMTVEVLNDLITKHEEANRGQEIITAEVEQARVDQRNNALSLIGETPVVEVTPAIPTEPENTAPIIG